MRTTAEVKMDALSLQARGILRGRVQHTPPLLRVSIRSPFLYEI